MQDKKNDITLHLNSKQLKDITKQVRNNGQADKRFDINLLEGKLSESEWSGILKTVEVKKDYQAHKTGNIAVEYSYKNKPSGISTTEAEYIAYILVDKNQNDSIAFFVKTEILKRMCRKYVDTDRNRLGGDDFNSKIILLPIKELTNPESLFDEV
tara:strand:+ start:212 stop:676 length:465 start_codon:yes stop_codon:yes gene_type:complete